MIASVDKVGYSDEEFKEMVDNDNFGELNIEEMLYAATLYQDNDTSLKIYSKVLLRYMVIHVLTTM